MSLMVQSFKSGLLIAAALSTAAYAQPKWHPTPYKGALPLGYEGEAGYRFFQVLAGSAARNRKDEFETTEAHIARTRDVAALIAPIDPQARYALRLSTVATYDANRQVFRVGYRDAYDCGLASLQNLKAETVLCGIAEQILPSDD